MAKEPGCPNELPNRPRAWVIRLPGAFVGPAGTVAKGSFQTIVIAPTEDMAWEVAMGCDVWEELPFQVTNVQIFPKEPVTNVRNSAG
jgi:hypothetical protein